MALRSASVAGVQGCKGGRGHAWVQGGVQGCKGRVLKGSRVRCRGAWGKVQEIKGAGWGAGVQGQGAGKGAGWGTGACRLGLTGWDTEGQGLGADSVVLGLPGYSGAA